MADRERQYKTWSYDIATRKQTNRRDRANIRR